MASSNKSLTLQCFLPLLALVCISRFTVIDSAAVVQVRGEVNGNVTFHCPVSNTKRLKFVYVQREHEFLNGYHMSKELKNKWPNTIMENRSSMTLFNLSISHAGIYSCHICYIDGRDILENHEIQLSVTANYSVPSVTKHCTAENQSCQVTCHSYGGYPKDHMEFEVYAMRNSSSPMGQVVPNSPVPNPSTKVYNSSSTATFNCSGGELRFTCFIGGVTSEMQTICAQDSPKTMGGTDFTVPTIAACVVIVVVIVALGIAYKHKCNKNPEERGMDHGDIEEGDHTVNVPLQGLVLENTGHGGMEAP